MKQRDDAMARAAETKTVEDKINFKNLRNNTANKIKQAKYKWEKQKLDNANNNANALWGNVKSWKRSSSCISWSTWKRTS